MITWGANQSKHGSDDASSTQGRQFKIGEPISSKFLWMRSGEPPVSRTSTPAHLARRKKWPQGQAGKQVGWDQHGKVQILKLDDGTEISVWWDETIAAEP